MKDPSAESTNYVYVVLCVLYNKTKTKKQRHMSVSKIAII